MSEYQLVLLVFAVASRVMANNALARGSGLMNDDRHDRARRCLVGAVAGEGGVVGACAGRAEARGDGDLAGGVGGVGGVVVADVVEVVVDGDVLRREGGSTARQSGVEGDGLVDGGGGGGRGEGYARLRLGSDVDCDDAAR